MRGRTTADAGNELAFESYGARVVVAFDDARLRDRIEALLPTAYWPSEAAGATHRLALRGDGEGGFAVVDEGELVTESAELEVALAALRAQLRRAVALGSRERIFVHAGVVAHRGRAIVIPAPTLSGKTTLVAALVRAGAVYYSDEIAVLDDDGRVHPYPKPLSFTTSAGQTTDSAVDTIGGVQGREPVPVGVILVTVYRPGAAWRPERRSAGQGALALMANTLPARDPPARALAATRRAAEDCVVLEGERGEAETIAADVLATAANGPPPATRPPAVRR